MFGENCDLIHSVVFDQVQARRRYKNPSDFSDRSIVQLRKKFKRDQNKIDQLIKDKLNDENVEWFEKKYGIDITNYNT